MCRQLIYLVSFVFVLCLVLTSVADAADPNLVIWWKLDDGGGTVAKDSSGNNSHGALKGDPQWVTGYYGGALDFDGAGDMVTSSRTASDLGIDGSKPRTITVWVYTHSFSNDGGVYYVGQDESGSSFCLRTFDVDNAWRIQYLAPDVDFAYDSKEVWVHFAHVYDGSTTIMYADGKLIVSCETAINTGNLTTFRIGQGWAYRHFDGIIDDIHVYNRVLTQREIQTVMLGTSGGLASRPNPDNEATDVPCDCILTWKTGEYAYKHNVYLGAIFDDVNEAGIADSRGVLVSQDQDPNTYDSFDFAQDGLEFSQAYYWRVDEVNAPPNSDVVYKGDVWSFVVEPFAYPISIGGITATASSFSTNQGPGKTVDGSGLINNDQHSTSTTAMWLSSTSGSQPTWIQYELDDIYKLHEMWVWNSNQSLELAMGLGIKSAKIEHSIDGSSWTQLGDVHEFTQAMGKPDYAHNTTIDFGGVLAKFVKITADSNWKGIFRQYGLSEVRFFYIPVIAWQPSPTPDQNGVSLDSELSWRAGRDATVHEVYLSSDREAVENSTALVGTVDRIRFPLSPLGLELTKTYYWKVDEVNEVDSSATGINTSWEGDIWSFTVADYVTVDDFERYEDVCNRIFYTWLDGYGHSGDSACGVEPYEGNQTGSAVGNFSIPFAERAIVHEGRQSMPFEYNNSYGSFYSETERRWAVAQDWTRGGAERLVLWFYGGPSNSVQPLYVAVEDGAGTVNVAVHGNPDSLLLDDWQEWSIPLTSFAGVDLSSVKKMYIGVGDRNAPAVDGTGKLYFDDIRLYP